MKLSFTYRGRSYVVKPPWLTQERGEFLKIAAAFPRVIHFYYLIALLEDDDLPKRELVLSIAERIRGSNHGGRRAATRG